MTEFDISVIINTHNEGILAHATVLSVMQARELAQQRGFSVQVIVVQDKPSPETVAYFRECKAMEFTTLTVSFGDPGLSRNAGVAAATGKWLAFIDADDLWGANWLTACYEAAKCERRQVIWHPEASLYFGIDPHIYVHVDMETPAFDLVTLTLDNYWTSPSFSTRALYLANPYPGTLLEKRLAYEDWSWNLSTVAWGAIHKVVPGTAHFIRQKEFSVNKSAIGSLAYPTRLIRDFLDKRSRE